MEPDDPDKAASSNLDEYERWKRCKPRAEKGSDAANDPIKYRVELRDRFPQLSRLALDVISIPASSCNCERMFSELCDLLEPRWRAIPPQLLAAIQCVQQWQKAGFGPKVGSNMTTTDGDLDQLYTLCKWDPSPI
jgi:hypothetical protein